MKKLLICLVISLIFVGCSSDNQYVKLAKDNGYWYTEDGISYGMSLEECRKILEKRDVEVKESVVSDNDDMINSMLTCEGEMYGQEVGVQFEFLQYKDDSILAKREWLCSMTINFAEPVPYADIQPSLEKELSYGKYESKGVGRYINTKTFGEISNINEQWAETPLDSTKAFRTEDAFGHYSVHTLSFIGIEAAAFAVAGNEGLDAVERLVLGRKELGRTQ